MEKELLSIVQTFKEYQPLLYGAEIHVHTDHRNLTYSKNLNSQRVIRWHLFIEEFHPQFHYILTGANNVIANTLSRVPRSSEEEESAVDKAPATMPQDDLDDSFFALEIDDPSLTTCLLHYPQLPENIVFPLEYGLIADRQQQDDGLLETMQEQSQQFHYIQLGQHNVICYTKNENDPWKICIPETLVHPIITWYHKRLNHIGMTRLTCTIATLFYNPHLKRNIEEIVQHCDVCQRYKINNVQYGKLPPREAEIAPWQEVAVDLIGPWKVKCAGQELTFNMLACINTVTNLGRTHLN